MILCRKCQSKMMVGALFCSECGAQLLFGEGITTSVFKRPIISSEEKVEKTSNQQPKALQMTWPSRGTLDMVSLNLVSSGESIKLTERKELTLGRTSKGQSIIPDIDLSPYKAYEAGVSRMHATIKIDQDQVSITDLGSVNGTRLNNKIIPSQTPHPLNNGDILTLGKLEIQILFQAKSPGG